MKRWYWICLLISFSISNALADSVIVNKAVSASSISRSALLTAFTMRSKRWPDGTKLTVFVFADQHPVHQHFVKSSLGLFPYQLRSIWDRILFSGAGQAPVTVSSEQEMIELVANTPGAIGYISETSQGGGDGYKVLEIR